MRGILAGSIVVLALMVLFPAAGYAECKVYNAKWKEYQTVVMENDLVKVVLIPASNGRIAEYIFKPDNSNQMRTLETQEVEISPDFKMISSNNAGYEDWIWEIGASTFISRNARYQSEILENTAEKCSVKLSYETNYGIERTLTIKEGSTLLDISVKLTNLLAGGFTYSYWAHLSLRPGGAEKIRDIMLVAPAKKNPNNVRNKKVEVPGPEGLYRKNVDKAGRNIFISPAQGWWGFVNQKNSIAIINIIPQDELGGDELIYCNNSELPDSPENYSLTMETIFKSKELLAGSSSTYHLSYAICKGFTNLLYADDKIIISSEGASSNSKNGKIKIKLKIGSPSIRKNVSLDFAIMDSPEKDKLKKTISLPLLSPLSPVEAELEFDGNLPAEKSCRIHVGLSDEKQNKIDQFEITLPLNQE